MRAGELLPRRRADPLAGERKVARLVRLEREPERPRIGDRVPHAAVGDVDRQRPEPRHLERRVEPLGEAGNVRQLDALAAAIPAGGARLDDAARRLQAHDRLGLVHRHHPGLEQHRDRADRIRARHRRILGRLHDDEAHVAVRPRRGDDEVRMTGDAARGSRSRSFRSQSPSRSSVCICSKTVAPAGGSTPPTTTFPISPPAWQPTTVISRRVRIAATLSRRSHEPARERRVSGRRHRLLNPTARGDRDAVRRITLEVQWPARAARDRGRRAGGLGGGRSARSDAARAQRPDRSGRRGSLRPRAARNSHVRAPPHQDPRPGGIERASEPNRQPEGRRRAERHRRDRARAAGPRALRSTSKLRSARRDRRGPRSIAARRPSSCAPTSQWRPSMPRPRP